MIGLKQAQHIDMEQRNRLKRSTVWSSFDLKPVVDKFASLEATHVG